MKLFMLAGAALLLTGATSATKHHKMKWVYAFELHADTVNGAPPEKPFVEKSQDTDCAEEGTSLRDLGLLLSGGLIKGCKIASLTMADGKIRFGGRCGPDAEGLMFDMQGDGVYNDDAIRIAIHAQGKADEDRAELSGTMTGKRIGPC